MSIEDKFDELDLVGVEIAPVMDYQNKSVSNEAKAPYKTDLSTIQTHYDNWSEHAYDCKAIDF